MTKLLDEVLQGWAEGQSPNMQTLLGLERQADLPSLTAAAQQLTLAGFGPAVSYSRKVFIPLTQLCRDACGYCTFALPARPGQRAYLTLDEVLAIATQGAAAGCKEALFTLGEKPELRYRVAREELQRLGCESTIDYLAVAARAVFEKTGLLPHLNPGILTPAQLLQLKPVAASMGVMLESTASHLLERRAAHWHAPDKRPEVRLATLRDAGELAIPYTTGILVGIGESRLDRLESLLAIRAVHERFGNIQEVIVQNFRAKPGTRMARHPEPSLEELCWSIAMARLVLGPTMSIQAPPNLSAGNLAHLITAGINDWGGVSPITPDYVNPEAAWPHLDELAAETDRAGRVLVERLAIVPRFARDPTRWLSDAIATAVRRALDANGFARSDGWHAGAGDPLPSRDAGAVRNPGPAKCPSLLSHIAEKAQRGRALAEDEIVKLFGAVGGDFTAIVRAADELRADVNGDVVSYVVNRNINYTNICSYTCGFCAFSKGRSARALRGPAYDLDLGEIANRVREAHSRGATEVCLQGGIHPRFTGATYLDIVSAVKSAVPDIHVHAFSPLEVLHGATTLGLPVAEYLRRLRERGLATLPGTAAEILDDEVRQIICPDKLTTAEWLDVMRSAHEVGLRSTATIMFGHVDNPPHWARHLLRIRELQEETGGFTEFVPLPFVHMEAPLWRRGLARSGPTFREAILMHSVARLALHPVIKNIQASWVKLGLDGALLTCRAGANDVGGTLMNESITRAAGGVHGQEQTAATLERAIRAVNRIPRQRTTLYGLPSDMPRAQTNPECSAIARASL